MAVHSGQDREGNDEFDPLDEGPRAGAAAEPLPLGDDADTRLPWLEADDAEEDDAGGAGPLIRLLLFAVVALALIVGAIWVVTRKAGDSELVADGSVIKAPPGPYKEKPQDPGGKTFDGTGDTSFAVSVGENRTSTLAQPSEAPQPGFNTVAPSGPTPKPAPAAAAAAPPADPSAAGGVGVQVGAYSSRTSAEAGWSRLVQQHSALSGHSHRVLEGKADIGTVYRLQAVAADAAAARSLCSGLRAAGLACQVKN